MHEGRRPSCISFHLKAAEPAARTGDTRRPEAPKGRILVNGLGGGIGGLPGVPGCDILELRIW